MVKVNTELGVNSDSLWDIYFDKLTNKLYMASLDKGLFVTDMSQIVNRTDHGVVRLNLSLVDNSFKHAFTNKIEQPQITIEVTLSTAYKIIYRISDNG